MKRTPLKRKMPLQRGSSQLARSPIRKVSDKQRDGLNELERSKVIVKRRSGGRCECGRGCGLPADHVHHRERRREGGHAPENLLHLNHACHVWAHAHHEQAVALGIIVKANHGE